MVKMIFGDMGSYAILNTYDVPYHPLKYVAVFIYETPCIYIYPSQKDDQRIDAGIVFKRASMNSGITRALHHRSYIEICGALK